LKDDGEVDPASLWDAVYPKENVHAATLLAILAADETGVEISSAIAAVLNDADLLLTAHREFTAHAKSEPQPPSLHSWVDDLERHNYTPIRSQLREALGGVLD
jgi:hypothetical protein